MNTPRTDAIAAKQRNINAFELVEVYNLMLEHARQLERENAELRKDAERYRWIRTAGAWESEIGMQILSESPEKFDAAVDAAKDSK